MIVGPGAKKQVTVVFWDTYAKALGPERLDESDTFFKELGALEQIKAAHFAVCHFLSLAPS